MTITRAEYGLLGWQGLVPLGGFERALWSALSVADSDNLAALAKGFPDEVKVLRLYRNADDYFTKLCRRAKV